MAIGEPPRAFPKGLSPVTSRWRGYRKQCWVRTAPPRGAKKATVRLESPPPPSAPVPSPDPVPAAERPPKARGASCGGGASACADCSRPGPPRREAAHDLPLLAGCSLLSGGSLPGRCPLPVVPDKACPRARCSPLGFPAAASPRSAPSFCVSPSFSISTSFLSSLGSSWSRQSRRPERPSGAGAAAQLPRVDAGPRPPLPTPLPPSSLLRPRRAPGRLVPVTIHFPEDCSLNPCTGSRGTKIHVHF